jgi:FkbH-like protein
VGKTARPGHRPLKCVIWDLDNTLWTGTLAESAVSLQPGVVELIQELDSRGVLNSIASRSPEESALSQLAEFGIGTYFVAPQINWGSKVASIQKIAEMLSIGLDSVAFVDDDDLERAEAAAALPEMRILEPRDRCALLDGLAGSGDVSEESRHRRRMYLAEADRARAEHAFTGPREAFLRDLQLDFWISPAGPGDIARAAELTVRTNQLNSTGRVYSPEVLERLRRDPNHDLLMARLTDRFGSYGRVGLALVERATTVWTLKMLLMSCRVISRGVGSVLLAHVVERARQAGVRLRAEFVDTGRNRALLIAYRFAGFRETGEDGNVAVLEYDPTVSSGVPDYVHVTFVGDLLTAEGSTLASHSCISAVNESNLVASSAQE